MSFGIINDEMEGSLGFLQKLRFPTGQVTSCDLSANCLLAVGLSDSTVRVMEWKVGLGFVDMSYSPVEQHRYAVTSVRFSPKGTMLASSSLDGTAVVMDVSEGRKVLRMVQHNKASIKFCEFSCDASRALTAGDDNIVCCWDLLHQRQISHFRFLDDDSNLRSLSLSPDSELLLVTDSADLLKLWFLGDGSDSARCILQRRDVHSDNRCSAFSPVKGVSGVCREGVRYGVVTCGGDGGVKVWDLVVEKGGGWGCELVVREVVGEGGVSVRLSGCGRYLVSTGAEGGVRVWGWEEGGGRWGRRLEGQSGVVTCAAFGKGSRVVASGSTDSAVVVWDLSGELSVDSRLRAACNVSCHFTDISLENYLAEGTEGGGSQRLRFGLRQRLSSRSIVSSVRFVSEEVLAVAGGEKAVTLWKRGERTAEFEDRETLQRSKYSITDVDVSSCGRKMIFCSTDGAVTFWDLNMRLSCALRSPSCSGSLRTGRFSPDSKVIAAAGDDEEVYLWDAERLEFVGVLQRDESGVTALAFGPDGKYLAWGCEGGDVSVRRVEGEGERWRVKNAHDLGVACCEFSWGGLFGGVWRGVEEEWERGYLLATGGKDSLVKLWGVRGSEVVVLTALSGHGGTVHSVSFSRSEPFVLASCSSDTTVRIWHPRTHQCLHVLDFHKSAVTTCSFSRDSSQLATGSLDKTVLIFSLSEELCRESGEWVSLGRNLRLVEHWTRADVGKWFSEMGWTDAAATAEALELDGKALLATEDDAIVKSFGLGSPEEQRALRQQVWWLKREAAGLPPDAQCKANSIPHMFLCPITHEVMKDPVICSDGFAYDRPALIEWFLSGKFVSPVTKEPLKTTKFLSYSALRANICKFFYENNN